MIISKGELIRELDGANKTLEVEGDWGGISKYVDFSARYQTPSGSLEDGTKVHGNRGFRYEDEGIVWERVTN